MTIEANKQVVRRFYEEVNERNLEAIDELAVLDYEEHDPLPGQGTGRAGLHDRMGMLLGALQPRFTIQDVVAEGDRVVVRWTNSGTHVGEFFGIPATGKIVSAAGVDIYRLEGGKMAEHWHVVDQLPMLQQLGVLPINESDGS